MRKLFRVLTPLKFGARGLPSLAFLTSLLLCLLLIAQIHPAGAVPIKEERALSGLTTQEQFRSVVPKNMKEASGLPKVKESNSASSKKPGRSRGNFLAAAELDSDRKDSSGSAETTYANLRPSEIVEGFRTDAVYVNESDKEIGARFRHIKSGLILDLVQIESVPQAFIWVNTVPTSDNGAPHTQEHLLLGKGNKGRVLGTLNELSLVSSSAMTMPWRTCYHFNTTAGAKVFFDTLGPWLDAFLNPDYTDSEIAREVCNLGVKEDPQDKKLSIEEKGTVYNEMQSAMHDPSWPIWLSRMQALYGKDHPLTFNSGGSPAGIRTLTPAQIRQFHKEHYQLSNMGMICTFPSNVPLRTILSNTNAILSRLQSNDVPIAQLDQSEMPAFPPARPLPADRIEIVPYPEKNKDKPIPVDIAWVPQLDIDPSEHLLLGMFLGNFAGDVSTPLYKCLVDGKTRTLNYGASSVSGGVSDELGFPIIISIYDVPSKHANEADLKVLRKLVQTELKKVAEYKPGSKELDEFNKRLASRLKQLKDSNAEFVNTPPRFGTRNLRGSWMEHLMWLERSGGFKRSLTMKPQLEFVSEKLKEKGNIWTAYLQKWRLIDTPAQITSLRPDPELLDKETTEKNQRIAKHLEQIKQQFKTEDEQKALALFKADYDDETQRLEKLQKETPTGMRFIDDPPMTQDDQLKFKVSTLKNGVPLVASTFDNMTISAVTLAMRVPQLPEEDLQYLPLLAQLLYRTGLIENGRALSYEQVLDRWRVEISHVYAYFKNNPDTHRYELAISGEGNSPVETHNAIRWMKICLESPNWRMANLQRIVDVTQHSLTALRKARDSGYEENWANEPAGGVRRQGDPLWMHLNCFLTKTHDVRRLLWRLKGNVNAKDKSAFLAFMRSLEISPSKTQLASKTVKKTPSRAVSATAPKSPDSQLRYRRELNAVLRAMQEQDGKGLSTANKKIYSTFQKMKGSVKQLATDAVNDLLQDLRDIPDSSLIGDWNQMCSEIMHDVQVPPATTLRKLEQIRKVLVNANTARTVVVGSTDSQVKVVPALEKMISGLPRKAHKEPVYPATKRVINRLIAREGIKQIPEPAYFAFFNEKTSQGVITNSTNAIKYSQLDDESLLRYLASQLYAGAGAHSLFMQTWAAGLAYGNGVSCSVDHRLAYYADKTPTAPQTIKFVVERLKAAAEEAKTKMDPALADYALAQTFFSDADGSFIGRGDYIADSIVDGKPPEVVRKFRSAVLAVRKQKDFEKKLFDRMIPQYARVIPGLTTDSVQDKDGVYMVIGDDNQLKQYETYLKSIKPKSTKLYVLYGRDYWI